MTRAAEPRRLDGVLMRAAGQYADRIAIGGDDPVSYRALAGGARVLATALTAGGCRPGEAVLLAVDNGPADLIGELAIWLAEAVVVPVSRTAPAAVVGRTAQRTAARFLVGPDLPAAWGPLCGAGPAATVHALADAAGPPPAELDRDQALVVFTSGSTGEPKGVVLSHEAFTGKLVAIQRTLPFAPDTTLLQVLHLHFSFGQWTSLLTLATGGRLELRRRFSVSHLLRDLDRLDVDRIAVVPSMLRMLLRAVDHAEPVTAPRSPRLWIAGGEPLPAALGRAVRRAFPHAGLADVFGLSESATSDLVLTPDRYDAEAGTLGRPTPGVSARVVGPDGVACAPGVPGELWLRTSYLMTGYLADSAATSAAVGQDGWLRTGDGARRRADGLLELTGRAKDVIVRGGTKISPLEVEAVYGEHPDCAACVAVGVPDEVLGQRMVLLVVPRSGRGVAPEQLLAWGHDRLEQYKIPERVEFVADLPAGRTGKLDRARARDLAAAVPAPATVDADRS